MAIIQSDRAFFTLTASCLYDASSDCVGMQSRGDTGILNQIRNTYLSLRERFTVQSDDRFGVFYSEGKARELKVTAKSGQLPKQYDRDDW